MVNAFYVEGMRVEDGSRSSNRRRQEGHRRHAEEHLLRLRPGHGHDIPPGDYVLVATMDQAVAEVPFTIASGEGMEINAMLNAGVLAIAAPGYDFIEILGKTDIAGNREELWLRLRRDETRHPAAGRLHRGRAPAG